MDVKAILRIAWSMRWFSATIWMKFSKNNLFLRKSTFVEFSSCPLEKQNSRFFSWKFKIVSFMNLVWAPKLERRKCRKRERQNCSPLNSSGGSPRLTSAKNNSSEIIAFQGFFWRQLFYCQGLTNLDHLSGLHCLTSLWCEKGGHVINNVKCWNDGTCTGKEQVLPQGT